MVHLTSPHLSRAGFRHGFFPGDETPDKLTEALGADALFQVTQVHGRTVHIAEGDVASFRAREGDALVARTKGHAIGVRTADCVPILVADPNTGNVAAIHAGWRGFVSGVIGEAIALLGGNPRTFFAALGPSIGPCCFEVGFDVAAQITGRAGEDVETRRSEHKAWIDLSLAAARDVSRAGIPTAHTEAMNVCTVCSPRRLPSYRRDKSQSGRILSAIVAQ